VTDELKQIEDEWAAAVAGCDTAAAEEILDEDFVLTSEGGVSDFMPRERWLGALPQIETRTLTCTIGDAREFGDIAVVRARLRWEARMGDRDLTGDYAVADVFRRSGGRWRAAWRISVRLADG
jgi:ketosteroid isomerase-like protein